MSDERILLGMNRPEWTQFRNYVSGGHVACNCGHWLSSVEVIRQHWQSGRFDTPIYATNEEHEENAEIVRRLLPSTEKELDAVIELAVQETVKEACREFGDDDEASPWARKTVRKVLEPNVVARIKRKVKR